jgi:hypothetical protein
MNNNCCLVIIVSQSLCRHPIKLRCERKWCIYTHTHLLNWTDQVTFWSLRKNEVKLYFTFFKSVNHNGKQHIYIAIATMISKWRWSRLMPFSLYRLESWIKRRGERESEEYFNFSWHTDALFLTFCQKKREKKESESK